MTEPALNTELVAAWASLLRQPHGSYGWTPAWFDETRGLLVVECINTAWLTQLRLAAPKMAEKLNTALPAPIIKKVVGCIQEVHVLVTGSRTWDDHQAVANALLDAWHDAVQTVSPEVHFTVVHGDCPSGADAIAKQWAIDNRVFHHAVPADWAGPCTPDCPPTPHRKTSRRGEYCPLAGHHRNQLMVDMGIDLVLAFRRNNSRGTTDCINRAKSAGIPVRILEDQHG
ncbi:DciA family protein [Streptomyces sp. LUP47B]|uniref:DciA family protein n=1 Tax=Streptomyces sp. LUP47B TaxID=1890286 RepID=UPI000ADDE9D2|nr:DciA family protein [Streptomyces sp. LUP47B]